MTNHQLCKTLIISACISYSAVGQLSSTLSVNNVNASFTANGGLFQNEYEFAGFTLNDANLKSAIFAGSSWIAAKVNDSLHLAVQDYHLLNDSLYPGLDISDFAAGPIANDYNGANYNTRYHRLWKISRQQIDYHRNHYQQVPYLPADAILEWPANGDSGNGEAAILAPFYDMDGDGQYQPLNGDYPVIAGDEAIYVIFNDENRDKPATATPPLSAEIHLMAYAFDSASNPAFHNSIFLHYQLFNRGSANWDSLVFSNWMDVDLGNATDDVVGSDSANSLIYAYNADMNDEGPLGFGLNPPAVGVQNLNANASGHMYYNRSGSGGPAGTSDPYVSAEYYNLMNSKWKDGHSLIVENAGGGGSLSNGDGYVVGDTGKTTKWAYEEAYGWTESPLNTGDKRQLFNIRVDSLPAGESLCLDFAYIYGRDPAGQDVYSSIQVVKNRAQTLRQYFNSTGGPCTEQVVGLSRLEAKQDYFEIYPNPTQGELQLKTKNSGPLRIEVYSINGGLILEKEWQYSSAANLKLEGPAGIYLLKLTSTEATASYRIMKR